MIESISRSADYSFRYDILFTSDSPLHEVVPENSLMVQLLNLILLLALEHFILKFLLGNFLYRCIYHLLHFFFETSRLEVP